MASIMLGRRTAALSTAISEETKRVIAGGYNIGAGSKAACMSMGIDLLGFRCWDAQTTSRKGYNNNIMIVTPSHTYNSRFHLRNIGLTNPLVCTMSPREATMTSSNRRRTISFLLRGPSIPRRKLALGGVFFESPTNPLSSSSSTVGGIGVEVPETTSFFPRNPLCSRNLGAGRPLRTCSSSASVPLQLLGVCSLETSGGKAVGRMANLSEAWCW